LLDISGGVPQTRIRKQRPDSFAAAPVGEQTQDTRESPFKTFSEWLWLFEIHSKWPFLEEKDP
jgi:hypothetical protein